MHLRQLCITAITLLAAQSVSGASATTCQTRRINGEHPLVYDCGDGTCGNYQTAADTDLGFGGPDPDVVYFQFYKLSGGPLELGAFDLASDINANYASCDQCILVAQDFVDSAPQPTKIFFQTSGTLDVRGTDLPGVAPDLTLIWNNLHLVEVTIDPDTYESIPVPDGDCFDVLPEVIQASDFEPTGYDPAQCAAVANTLDIQWHEVDAAIPTCVGIEHTNGSLLDATDGKFTMDGTSVTDACLGTGAYSFSLSADKHTLYGVDSAYKVAMALKLSSDNACFVGHWKSGASDFIATIWNFAGP